MIGNFTPIMNNVKMYSPRESQRKRASEFYVGQRRGHLHPVCYTGSEGVFRYLALGHLGLPHFQGPTPIIRKISAI